MMDYENCLKEGTCKLTIRGVTQDGDKFRPSAWTNMLVDSTKQHSGLMLTVCEGIQCIDLDIESDDAKRIMQFANDNKLLIEERLT